MPDDELPELDFTDDIVDVHWGDPPMYIMSAAFTGDGIFYSFDGKSWTEGRSPSAPGLSTGIISTVQGNGIWLGQTTAGLVRSEDGITWEISADPGFGQPLVGLGFNGEVFLAVSFDTNTATSKDGHFWTAGPRLDPSDDGSTTLAIGFPKDPKIRNSTGMFLVGTRRVVQDENFVNTTICDIYASPTGKGWARSSNVGAGIGGHARHVAGFAYGGGRYAVAIGVDDFFSPGFNRQHLYVLTSSNGKSWGGAAHTGVSPPSVGFLGFTRSTNLTYGDGKFVIVGTAYRTPGSTSALIGKIASSPNGSSWKVEYTADRGGLNVDTIKSVAFKKDTFVAGGTTGNLNGHVEARIWYRKKGGTWSIGKETMSTYLSTFDAAAAGTGRPP